MGSGQGAKMSVKQQPPTFGGTCLPLTMELAHLARNALLPSLVATPRTWSFEDRVLVLLAPSMRTDVEGFVGGTTASMADSFEPHQLEHLAQSFMEQLLALVARLSPTTVSGIMASVEPVASPGSAALKR